MGLVLRGSGAGGRWERGFGSRRAIGVGQELRFVPVPAGPVVVLLGTGRRPQSKREGSRRRRCAAMVEGEWGPPWAAPPPWAGAPRTPPGSPSRPRLPGAPAPDHPAPACPPPSKWYGLVVRPRPPPVVSFLDVVEFISNRSISLMQTVQKWTCSKNQ